MQKPDRHPLLGARQSAQRMASLEVIVFAVLLGMAGAAAAQGANGARVSTMAPVAEYLMASASEEISLARSAAPPSISQNADILVLGKRGYETAVKGNNGFVCLVERSWFGSFSDPAFWNPKIRGPDCLNAAAARSVLPTNLERTQWALSGLSLTEMKVRSKTSAAAHQAPSPGAIGYMMSKQQILTDGGHWHPHLMFFQAHTPLVDWGANLPGSPVMASESDRDEVTIFVIPVGTWSDGTS
jgi:hypothetical protein